MECRSCKEAQASATRTFPVHTDGESECRRDHASLLPLQLVEAEPGLEIGHFDSDFSVPSTSPTQMPSAASPSKKGGPLQPNTCSRKWTRQPCLFLLTTDPHHIGLVQRKVSKGECQPMHPICPGPSGHGFCPWLHYRDSVLACQLPVLTQRPHITAATGKGSSYLKPCLRLSQPWSLHFCPLNAYSKGHRKQSFKPVSRAC